MPKQSKAPESKILAAMGGVTAGLSHRTAAKRYGVPLGTLKARLRRAQVEQPTGNEPDASDLDASDLPDASVRDAIPRRRPSPPVPQSIVEDERLDSRRMRAAVLLVQGHMPINQIAAEVGVSTSGLRDWRRDVVFEAVCSDLRREMHQRAREAISRGAEEGVDGLRLSVQLLKTMVEEGLEAIAPLEEEEVLTPAQRAAEDKRRALALSLAMKAAKDMPTAARALMDAGGFPKTERIEVDGKVVTLKDRSLEELEEEEAALEIQLRLLEGGAA